MDEAILFPPYFLEFKYAAGENIGFKTEMTTMGMKMDLSHWVIRRRNKVFSTVSGIT